MFASAKNSPYLGGTESQNVALLKSMETSRPFVISPRSLFLDRHLLDLPPVRLHMRFMGAPQGSITLHETVFQCRYTAAPVLLLHNLRSNIGASEEDGGCLNEKIEDSAAFLAYSQLRRSQHCSEQCQLTQSLSCTVRIPSSV